MITAAAAIVVACLAAIGVSFFFGILLLRRWHLERRDRARMQAVAIVTRSYLQRIGGFAPANAPTRGLKPVRLEAVGHLHLLLRGAERQRLMQLAELDGLLAHALRASRSRRAARRIDAIRALQQFGSEGCIARLRAMLARDRNPAVRLEAAFALASLAALPPPRELVRLLGMFEHAPHRLDSALLRAAAAHYPDHLTLMLGDDLPPRYRALIVDALGYSDDPAVLPTLQAAFNEPFAEVRSAALRGAARIGHPAVAEWVIGALDDPVAFVRVQAANSCALLALQAAAPALRAHMTDPDLWVRLRCESALDVLMATWPDDASLGAAA